MGHCSRRGLPLAERNFSVRYQSNIPRQVGMAGSSAIIVATLRALMDFYQVSIPPEVQPSLALSVETDELGIAAGLQDRVIQVYEGVVYMDFARDGMQDRDGLMCGIYEPLDPALLPPLYLAYSTEVSEPTEIFHNDLRGRHQRGEKAVVDAMQQFALITTQGREALLAGDFRRFGELVNANFDLRRSICPLPPEQARMVDVARAAGATSHFAGSGGAVVGTYPDDATYARLASALSAIGCRVIRPVIS